MLRLVLFVSLLSCSVSIGQEAGHKEKHLVEPLTPPSVAAAASFNCAFEGPVNEEMLSAPLAVITSAADTTVVCHFDTPGGDAFATLRFLMEVRAAKEKNHVRIACTTGSLVASAGSIIYESICDERHASPETLWLFHGVATGVGGKAATVEDTSHLMRVMDRAVAIWIAPRLGMTPDAYVAWVDAHDRWLSTEELLKMGGVDDTKQPKTVVVSPVPAKSETSSATATISPATPKSVAQVGSAPWTWSVGKAAWCWAKSKGRYVVAVLLAGAAILLAAGLLPKPKKKKAKRKVRKAKRAKK
jgi:ATP-dependent protease ClpP protease subunit